MVVFQKISDEEVSVRRRKGKGLPRTISADVT
jgi:hypothetical protein